MFIRNWHSMLQSININNDVYQSTNKKKISNLSYSQPQKLVRYLLDGMDTR